MCTDALDEYVALKIEIAHSSATSVNIYKITWYHIQKESDLHSHCCENLRLHRKTIVFVYDIQRYKIMKKIIQLEHIRLNHKHFIYC
jgi:hypothetical protein